MSAPFDWQLPYPSRRQPVLAANLVATSHPLAVQAGLEAMAAGGNAVDGALAAAITLVVVEPTNNGLGADAFAIVARDADLIGVNGSGRSPRALDAERLAAADRMPLLGWDTVTVPGAVGVWQELSERFGRLAFGDLFRRAIRYAREGYPVSPVTAELWRTVAPLYAEYPDFGAAFLPRGRAPQTGERFALPALADSLETLSREGARAFYTGDLAARVADCARAAGAALTEQDLAAHRTEYVEPLSVGYRGWRLHELPPNGQGLAALIALGVLERTPVAELEPDSAESLHVQIEAMKLALADVERHVADPDAMEVDAAALLEPAYLDRRAAEIDLDRAVKHGAGASARTRGGDTVYLTAADDEGTMVSFIQSNYFAFGSGVVVPGTGISLQNRGACFSTAAGHPNRVGPGKRPFHTIIPAFVTRDGAPVMSFGVMGGAMQPQGHVQVMVRIVDHGRNPQAAIDAPRWQVSGALDVALEAGFSEACAQGLARRGHAVQRLGPEWFGGAQAAFRLESGYVGASEPRKDGLAAGF